MKLAALFSDHMVLQRGQPVPVWGGAEPGERVQVQIAGQTAAATAGANGKWRAILPPLPAGGPYDLTVTGRATLTRHDVLVGEVWVASGQSNMQMYLESVANADAELAAANHPQIRLFTVPNVTALEPQEDVKGQWAVCTTATVPQFSAVAYFFGRELHAKLGVPVGLINASWGGTEAGAWTSRAALQAEPSLKQAYLDGLDHALAHADELNAVYQAAVTEWEKKVVPRDPGNAGFPRGWADPATNTRAWATMRIPQLWNRAGHNTNGVFWFRKEVTVPPSWKGRDLTLSIGACDKSDVTYFNNVEVGHLSIAERADAWCTQRHYTVPAALVKPGRNVIAVRVFSHLYGGGMTGPASLMQLTSAGAADGGPISLAGDWQYQIEHDFGLTPFCSAPPPWTADNPNAPTVLYNAMIAPLIPYGIRGAIWYQGESNAARAREYRTLFPALIGNWRRDWGQGEFPFYFVQLANYLADQTAPFSSRWAELREAQTMTLRLPQTGMAVAIDVGDPGDIHPTNKQEVGHRLALHALARIHDQPLTWSGPLFRTATVEGPAIRLTFDHVDGGLVARGGPLTGFGIAGKDRAFVSADALLDGATIVVTSPQVPQPVAVRYAWADNPAGNLYNQAGLPASPFRTDDWP